MNRMSQTIRQNHVERRPLPRKSNKNRKYALKITLILIWNGKIALFKCSLLLRNRLRSGKRNSRNSRKKKIRSRKNRNRRRRNLAFVQMNHKSPRIIVKIFRKVGRKKIKRDGKRTLVNRATRVLHGNGGPPCKPLPRGEIYLTVPLPTQIVLIVLLNLQMTTLLRKKMAKNARKKLSSLRNVSKSKGRSRRNSRNVNINCRQRNKKLPLVKQSTNRNNRNVNISRTRLIRKSGRRKLTRNGTLKQIDRKMNSVNGPLNRMAQIASQKIRIKKR